jgi:hypothetical protein
MDPHTIFETDTNQEHGSIMSSMRGARPDDHGARASGHFGNQIYGSGGTLSSDQDLEFDKNQAV